MTYPDQPHQVTHPRPGHGQPGYPPVTGHPAAYAPAANYPAGPSAVPLPPGTHPNPYGSHQGPTPDAHEGWSAAARGLALYGARTLTRPPVGHPALYLFAIVVGVGMVFLGAFVALAL